MRICSAYKSFKNINIGFKKKLLVTANNILGFTLNLFFVASFLGYLPNQKLGCLYSVLCLRFYSYRIIF